MSDVLTRLAVEITGNVDALKRELEARGAPALDSFARKAEAAGARAKRAATDGVAAIEQRVKLLERGLQVESTREASLRKLAGVESGLSNALKNTNLSLQQRVRLEEQLARVQTLRNPAAPAALPDAAKLRETGDAAKKAAFDLADLVPAFNGLAAKATGLDSTLGTLAGTIGSIGSAQVTGVVLAGAAIIGGAYTFISSEARKAKEQAKEADQEFRRIAGGRDLGTVAQRRAQLFSGNQYSLADDPRQRRAEELGIAGLRREIAAAERTQRSLAADAAAASAGRAGASQQRLRELDAKRNEIETQRREVEDQIAFYRKSLKALEAEHKKYSALEDRAAQRDAAATDFDIRQGRAERAVKGAQKTGEALADFFRYTADIVAQASAEMADDVALKLERLTARAKALGQTQSESYLRAKAALEQQAAAAAEARRAAEEAQQAAAGAASRQALDQALAAATVGRIGREFDALLQSAEALHFGLVGLSEGQVVALGEWEESLKRLAPTSKEAAALLERIQKARTENRAGGGTDPGTPDTKKAHDWAAEIGRGARALLDAAGAAGLLDDNLASALQSAINLADNVAKIIATKGKDVGSIVGAVSAAVALGTRAFGTSEEERQRRSTDAASLRAIEAIARAAGDLAGLTASGRAFSGVRSAVSGVVSVLPSASDRTRVRNPEEVFARAGLSLADAEAVARTLGVTLDGTVGSFRRLDEAIRAADFRAFADSWGGAMQELDVLFDVDNVDTPLGQLLAFTERLRDSGAAALQAFAAFDLSSPEGRAIARQGARDMLRAFLEGTLDPSALGGLNPTEFIEAIRRFVNGIDDVEAGLVAATPAMAAAATEAERAAQTMSVLAVALGDIAAAADILGTDGATQLAQTVAAYATAFPAFADRFRGLLDGIDVATADGFATLQARVRAFYEELLQGGLTEEERNVVGELVKVLGSARGLLDASVQAGEQTAAAIRTAGDYIADVAAQLSQAAEDSRLLGDSPEAARMNRYGVFVNDRRLSDIAGIVDVNSLESLDATIPLIRDAFRNATGELRQVFGNFLSFLLEVRDEVAAEGAAGGGPVSLLDAVPDGINAEWWGTLSPDQKERFYEAGVTTSSRRNAFLGANAVMGVNVSAQGVAGAASIQGLSAAQGGQISDYLSTLVTIARQQLAALTAPMSPTGVPQIPGFGARASGVDQSVHLAIGPVVIGAGAGAADGAAAGRAFTTEVRSGLPALADDYRWATRVAGDRTVRGGVG